MSPAARRFLLVIILLAILIVAAFYTYKQSKVKKPSQPPVSNTQQTTGSESKVSPKPVTLKELPASPTAKEVRSFVENIQATAQAGDTLEVNNKCEGNPAIFKVKKNQGFNIKNTDSLEHTISFGGNSYKVGPGKSVSVKGIVDAAIYNYSCSTTGGEIHIRAGTIYVVK